MPSSGQADYVVESARRRSPREPYRGSTGYSPPLPPPSGPGFTNRAATEFAEVTYGQLDYWDTLGIVRPSRNIDGRPFYSYGDLIELHLVKRLLKKSAREGSVGDTLNDLRRRSRDGILGSLTAELTVSGSEVIPLSPESQVSDADTVRLADVKDHVKEKLDKAKVDLTKTGIVSKGMP